MALGVAIIVGVALLLFVLIALGYVIGIYNSIIKLKNDIGKSWSNIDVLLKQRAEELPKLIASVKGYMKHESSLLENITRARSALLGAKTMGQKAKADNMITESLKTLFAVAENYPKLQANENFMHLQQRISGLENELADRREFYNDSVNTFNVRIETVPGVFFAGPMSLAKREMFKATEAEKKDVKVEF